MGWGSGVCTLEDEMSPSVGVGAGAAGGTAAVVAAGVECGGAERGCNCKNLCA